jgi:hypothetical protein
VLFSSDRPAAFSARSPSPQTTFKKTIDHKKAFIHLLYKIHKVKIENELLFLVTTVPEVSATVPEDEISLFCVSFPALSIKGWYFSLDQFFFFVNMLLLSLSLLSYMQQQ